ncbi:type VI secretion system contractile sheath domain-containing protein [Tropicimonas sp. S265A]|uniref:type VI secretion system contractile sheath domain-containing protein n=1 Tax=Tropicimonas sp. S265A TaxID=3415134 RepID=UPI003C7BE2B6
MPSNEAFQLAILGDFSGRAARGVIETGLSLAERRPVRLDIDTLDDVLSGFGMEIDIALVGQGPIVSLSIAGLEDLHPDTLFERLPVFADLAALRNSLAAGTVAPGVLEKLRALGAELPVLTPEHRAAKSVAVPADRPLSAFEELTGGAIAPKGPSAVDDLLAALVGPHLVSAPDPDARALVAVVDRVISDTMNLILHHPEVQAIEAVWRALDLLARRIDTEEGLSIILFDVSAEELAVDLAANDDPAASGLAQLLSRHSGAISACAGLYTFETTPPHADLLARLAQIASAIQAPFVTGMDPDSVANPLENADDRVSDSFRALAQADVTDFLGLVTPPVLMRRVYGAKSDPITAFDYEEFSASEGLSGMVWGSPAVLVALLLAENRGVGQTLDVDDMPYHVTQDRHGDQVMLPPVFRMIPESRMVITRSWGVMSVLASGGGDRVRLAGFHAVSGNPLAGPWTGAAPARPKSPRGGVGLTLSVPLSTSDLAEIRGQRPKPQETGPDDIDPDLAALLENLR